MVKWDLYRYKAEQVEDDYADFKRHQKKVYMFVGLIARSTMLQRLQHNFYLHRAYSLRKLQKIYVVNKLRFKIKR